MNWILSTAPGIERHPAVRWLARVPGADRWNFIRRPVKGKTRHLSYIPCAVLYCRHTVPRRCKDKVCARCKMLRWRINNPLKSSYKQVRDRALRKRIPFHLSFDEYQTFAIATGYADGVGPLRHQLHIDRIDATRGYFADNIQVLTCSVNSSKAAEDKKAHWLARRMGTAEPEDNCPF